MRFWIQTKALKCCEIVNSETNEIIQVPHTIIPFPRTISISPTLLHLDFERTFSTGPAMGIKVKQMDVVPASFNKILARLRKLYSGRRMLALP